MSPELTQILGQVGLSAVFLYMLVKLWARYNAMEDWMMKRLEEELDATRPKRPEAD